MPEFRKSNGRFQECATNLNPFDNSVDAAKASKTVGEHAEELEVLAWPTNSPDLPPTTASVGQSMDLAMT